jgi:hypothetical protein
MLECLHLAGAELYIYNHSLNCGDLRDSVVDPLNSAILSLTQRAPIKRLNLEHWLVSTELFTGSSDSIWAGLRQFDISGGSMAPSGEWYWTGDPTSVQRESTAGYGSDYEGSTHYSSDSDISWHRSPRDDSGSEDNSDRDAIRNGHRPNHAWRNKPDWGMLTPLLVGMARAVHRMPNLQRGRLLLRDITIGDVCVECAAPGFRYADRNMYEPKKFRTCRFFVGEADDKTTWLTLEQLPDEVRSTWREWLGEQGVMEIHWPKHKGYFFYD